MEELNNDQLYKKIKKALTDEGTILFVGSGVSAWSGLPNWRNLLDELADFVDNKGISSVAIRSYIDTQPLIAAGIGRNLLSNTDFAEFIRSACRIDTAKPHLIHELIVNLGASCYITTNYDSLLEQTLQQHGLLKQYKVVNNQKVLDCAEIVHIKGKNFIFKPHGDVGDCESIILSAEQYQSLYENGDKTYVYRTLETLLLTRTVIFIGFGLTDPDFLNIVGKIKNEFQRNPRDHFAIIPDVSNEEKNYWFSNYGIQILSYETQYTENRRDFSILLPLLRSLAVKNNSIKVTQQRQKKDARISPKQKQILERYSRYLIQRFKTSEPVFSLMLQINNNYSCYSREVPSSEVQNITTKSFVLTGNPGAGKSFFLKQYCIRTAERLQNWCLNPKDNTFPKIPVYVDLKDYSGKGSLKSMIESQLPEGIPISDWAEHNRVILFIDAFNEVDKKFLDNRSCLNELKQFEFRNTIVIASRFKEPLDDLGLPEYRLLEIEKDDVDKYLEQCGYIIPDYNQEEIYTHFQKPLFFYLLTQGKLTICSDPNPISPISSYFDYINTAFESSFGYHFTLENIFQEFAYDLFIKGTETFGVAEVYDLLTAASKNDSNGFDADVIINWLIETQHFLTPISSKNLAFFHQSITEFLAAHHFSIQYQHNKVILNEQLSSTRWDYVLLYVAALLDKEYVISFFDKLLQTDSILAIRASAYFKYLSEQIVTMLLGHLIEYAPQASWDYWMELTEHFSEIPLMPVHEPLLRRLMTCKDIIGGLAACGLLRACKGKVKAELLEEMFNNLSIKDYNFSEELGSELSNYITLKEYRKILVRLGDIEIEHKEHEGSLCYGFDRLAQNFKLDDIIKIFKSLKRFNTLQINILTDILRDDESQEGFDQSIKLIKDGFVEAVIPAYFLSSYHSEHLLFDKVDGGLLLHLANMLADNNLEQGHKWIIGLIYTLYQKVPPFAKEVRASLKYSDGVVRLSYLYSIGKNRNESFFSLYSSMLYSDELPFDMIDAFDNFDWGKSGDHIIGYLLDQQRLDALAEFCGGNLINRNILYEPSLSVFVNLINSVTKENGFTGRPSGAAYDKYRIGEFLAQYMIKDDLLAFYHTANKDAQRFFNQYVLNRVEDLALQDFTQSERASMIDDLRAYRFDEDVSYDDEILLSNIADKEFIASTLMPLFDEDNLVLKKNIHRILEKSSEKQGVRYIKQ